MNDGEAGGYVLGFPNKEVKYGFLKSLFSEYVPTKGRSLAEWEFE